MVDVVLATRNPANYGAADSFNTFIHFGASPRATISLALAAKAFAFMQGSFVTLKISKMSV